MSCRINFATKFSSFRVDPNPDKYLFNTFNLILPMQHDKTPAPKVESEDKRDIQNPSLRYLYFKKGLQHPTSIFDKHSS